MAADYLVSSLQPLDLDGSAPYTLARFLEMCRDQLPASQSDAIAAAVLPDGGGAASRWSVAAKWRDLDVQIRNAVAAERARAQGLDPAKWRRPADGCSLHWANRVAACFQEKDPGKRDRLLDLVRWDAAGELTPPASPLSAAAAFTYALRLAIVVRRQALSADSGNEVFNRLTAATKITF